jgi:Family of unknown function (DUF6527)
MNFRAIKVKTGHIVRCHACGWHIIPDNWKFDGNYEQPTFAPSVRITYGEMMPDYCCHFFMTAGVMEYQGDCSHNFKGQKLRPEPFSELETERFNGLGYQDPSE